MSFSDDLRDELASIAPRRRCCQIAELSGLCHAAGVWHLMPAGILRWLVCLALLVIPCLILSRGLQGKKLQVRTYRFAE